MKDVYLVPLPNRHVAIFAPSGLFSCMEDFFFLTLTGPINTQLIHVPPPFRLVYSLFLSQFIHT